MSFTASFVLSQDATFRGRVQIAMAKTALAIGGEALGVLKPLVWIKRQDFVKVVLSAPTEWTNQFALAVCTNDSITALSTDSDIEFMVSSTWDDLAGVTGNDLQ